MIYELWNVRAGMRSGFASEAAALATVRAMLERRGARYADHLLLGYEDAAGRSTAIAQGQALAERAFQALASPKSVSASSVT
jgi:hypothetical protein